ncbi:MAG: hypothetical protein ACTHXA_09825 [Gulosibacter sp.]|uniref:hypothetical protein n=1 Tax=Gulosibacter sp. TaxID=2817531 RepID=UPI003F8F0D03
MVRRPDVGLMCSSLVSDEDFIVQQAAGQLPWHNVVLFTMLEYTQQRDIKRAYQISQDWEKNE